MRKTVGLEPNHSHFILVDDGSVGKFGGEIDLRTALENGSSDNVGLVVVDFAK